MLKSKKIIISILSIVILASIIVCFYLHGNIKDVVEILPEEEISDEQYRKTMISLYFKNKNTNELMPEVQLVDVKLLINEPYVTILNLLMEKPKNDNLECVIPEGTKINKVELKSDILWIDFSKEFIENHPGSIEEEKCTIYSIVNTLTELTEVNGIKILIDNEENKSFKDNSLGFGDIFIREKNNNFKD